MRSPLAALTFLAVTGLSTPPAPRATDSGGEIIVKAMDFAFEMPAVVRPGPRTIRLVNQGPALHHMMMFRLEGDKTAADLLAAMKPGAGLPAWVKDAGGPNAPVPGGESVAVVDLAVGHYVVVCLIPSDDGKPHLMKGMVKSFEVAGKPVARIAPQPTVMAVLDDYSFALSKPLSPGHQVIEFSNRAKQAHEAFLAKLAPGKTAADLLRWLDKQVGPPPAMPVGGITGIAPGSHQSIIVDLTPGNYAWFCFLPAPDGQEHIKHGMVNEFQIGAPARVAGPAGGR